MAPKYASADMPIARKYYQPDRDRIKKMAEYIPRALEKYKKEIIPYMMKRFGYTNVHQVPRIEKICLNMGVGDAKQDPKLLENAINDLGQISGQKPAVTKAKKSVSNFKLRAGMTIGCRVTLRRKRLFEFLDRFITIAIPRIRDFRGLPDTSLDGRGNYTVGIKEQIIFPEINVDKIDRIRGLDITFVTNAGSDEEAFELLKAFGMPFRKQT
jgi:large subunit ribosomal protein L5